ncbi:MAG TPA: 23S rRNA (pseudouridine(1915)-N(3))-methyltransferase RlmH [Candidatus Peribacteraceae bacterium]|nr:23S rRNA (pseudouridine(1915)-N(3))-methyltransferase RlmH [Candidatus Peribacteraceae bacterium]
MQKITLVSIGHPKESWARDASAFYAERLKHAIKFEVMDLPASRETDPVRQMEDESRRLLKFVADLDSDVWVLDERGSAMSSPAFAKVVAQARDAGRPMIFLLGGSYGLNDAVRSAGRILRLSDMVLPHELCRVVFLEQLYRALEINRGSGYHH